MILLFTDIIVLILGFSLLHTISHRHMQLSYRIILSLLFGLGYGLLLKLTPSSIVFEGIKSLLYFIGHAYLALLKMLVIPLIITSIIYSIVNLGSGSSANLKRMSAVTCFMLLSMTSLASLIGIFVGRLFSVGEGLLLPLSSPAPLKQATGLVDTLLGMIPSNPVGVMSQENTIAVVLFAIFIGIAARMLDGNEQDKMKTFTHLFAALFAIVKKLTSLVLGLTPYGILSLMALLMLEQGMELINGMLTFMLAMYVAMGLVILMHCFILLIARQNIWVYFQKSYAALLIAFTTRSSFGSLPVVEETLRNKFQIDQMTATFVPSIGATIGMNACAGVFPAMLVVMTLTMLHQPLTLPLILTIAFINAIASLGISGIPGTAYIAATVSLTSLNLPYAVIALVQGIDPLIDMGRTATNVNGVMTTALVVDKIFKEKNG